MKDLGLYPFEVRPLSEQEGGGFLISFPDFSECISDGETVEEAIRNGWDALEETIAALESMNLPIPEPIGGKTMNELTYRKYTAKIEYDSVDKIFVGHIVGIRDIVGFHGSTVAELESAFQDAVNHYLEVCERIGQKPQKSYSGKLTLRVPPQTH